MRLYEGKTMEMNESDGIMKITEVTRGSITARISADAAVIDTVISEGSSGTHPIEGYEMYYEMITDSKALKEMEIKMPKQDFKGFLREFDDEINF